MAKMSKEVRLVVARLDSIIKEYKLENPGRVRDLGSYEQEYKHRLKRCFAELEPLVEEAVSLVKVVKYERRGNDPKLSLKQKVLLLLLKQLCGKSNRAMEWMLVLFYWLTGIDVSYKTIERLYSDDLVGVACYNVHVLILKQRGIVSAECCGDGTGYALFVRVHYATEAKKRKEAIKENDGSAKHVKIIYSFALMDITTRMYLGYGTSFRSEKEACEHALHLAQQTGIRVQSLRLDKYYSAEAYVNLCRAYLGDVKMYLIPKKNIAHFGLGEWCSMLQRFLDDQKAFLKEYFQRNQSESGIAEDKKRTGWRIPQKLEKRVDTAYTLNALWHNLYWLGKNV